MSLTIQALRDGIHYWQTQTNWPSDFHAAFYAELRALHAGNRFNAVWWDQFLPILRQWRATRPRSSDYLTQRFNQRVARLNTLWTQDITPLLGQDIETVPWIQVEAFTQCVAEIKNVESPVFVSKFCHFLAPAIFPVVDNAAMGNPFATYQAYYETVQAEWMTTKRGMRSGLVYLLESQMGTSLDEAYPTACKLVELCLMGRHTA